MNFELLPNELILHIFEYLSLSHLFRAFHRLNTRFNQLLLIQFQGFHLDFRTISKTEFYNVCQNYLPSIQNQIISLQLSNDDDTPEQIKLFLSFPIQIHQLTRLQSIIVTHIRSKHILNQIMIQCSSLPFLQRLKFNECHIELLKEDAMNFYNQIWNLPKLTYCYINICFAFENYFPNPTVVSTSLRYLLNYNTSCSSSDLVHLCQHTPNLQQLSATFNNNNLDNYEFSSSILSVTRLTIIFYNEPIILKRLLQNLPRLQHLIITIFTHFINGNEWEEMIRKNLHEIKTFSFKMKFPPPVNSSDKEIQMNEILDSFRTKFWIEEHQWFVRCHWYTSNTQQQPDDIHLFTIPYIFKHFFTEAKCILAKSTDPNDHEYLTFNHTKFLYYDSKFFTDSLLSYTRFPNVEYLSLTFPFHEQFLKIVPKFDRLTVLHISINKNENLDTVESQIQFVFNQANHLDFLMFGIWPTLDSDMPPVNLVNNSIHRLDVKAYTNDFDCYTYDTEQCIQLARSSLGMQCVTLVIRVKTRENIFDLLNNMPNLQALIIRFHDDTWGDEDDTVVHKQDTLLDWLQDNLPSTCTIIRDTYLIGDIRIWIR